MIMFLICFSYVVIVGGTIGYIAENFISDRFGIVTAFIFVLVATTFMPLPLMYMVG